MNAMYFSAFYTAHDNFYYRLFTAKWAFIKRALAEAGKQYSARTTKNNCEEDGKEERSEGRGKYGGKHNIKYKKLSSIRDSGADKIY